MKKLLLSLTLFCFVRLDLVHAEKRAWSCLIYANLREGESDSRLKPYLEDLNKIFGYKRYDVIGSAWGTEKIERQNLVLPSKEYYLRLMPLELRDQDDEIIRMDIELFQGKDVILKSRIKMPMGKPLLISGPIYGEGQLIILLELRQFDGVDNPRFRP